MALEAGHYNMQCWHSTSNPAQTTRSRLAFQCLQLIKALQARFTHGEIAIPSTDKDEEISKGIEICIVYRPENELFGNIADFLSKTAADLSFDYRDFVKEETGITRYLSSEQIGNVSLLSKPVPDNVTEEQIAEVVAKVEEFKESHADKEWKEGIKPEQNCLPFQISRATLERLHKKEGNDLAEEIKSIIKGIKAAQIQTKTSMQAIEMIIQGVLSFVFPDSWLDALGSFKVKGLSPIYTGLFIYIRLMIWYAFVTEVSVAASVLSVITATTFKDAANVLLVVNDTATDVIPIKEWIEHGERHTVPEVIPPSLPNGDLVSCGLFIYEKYQIKGHSVSAYGSAFGVSFGTGHGKFSVGMNCPNSFLGGNNSIAVHNMEHAKGACDTACGPYSLHGWSSNPHVDVKIADGWGNVNWGRALVIKDD